MLFGAIGPLFYPVSSAGTTWKLVVAKSLSALDLSKNTRPSADEASKNNNAQAIERMRDEPRFTTVTGATTSAKFNVLKMAANHT